MRPEVKDLKNPPSHYLRRFHYDTVAHSSPILMNLVQQVGVDRVVAGHHFPADMSDVDPVRTVESLTALSTAERDLILPAMPPGCSSSTRRRVGYSMNFTIDFHSQIFYLSPQPGS